MNIQEAKLQITNTLRAYLQKDELGNYRIPAVRQRPVLLMGPPGVGKTQIMEQIASETGVGLVAYTITHHTRQSAIGLPFIEKQSYDGVEYSVTEYTMSEILNSVYRLMENTGIREGILFLDEINCVSETLAPMMLQFLQCKTFGNQKLPEGWLIVAAGNPPEYNRSVRDFDVVTLDRVKRINVEEDFRVWKDYALKKNLHSAVVTYLDIKKENFYRIENTADGLQFATARGWEDLSEVLYVYEELGILADRTLIEQYIQLPAIAKDFANYLALYYKYQKTYQVEEILRGKWQRVTASEFHAAPFDEKLSVMGLLYARLAELARHARQQDALTVQLHGDLSAFKAQLAERTGPEILEDMLAACRGLLKRAADAGQNDRDKRSLQQREINALEDYLAALRKACPETPEESMDVVRPLFSSAVEQREALIEEASVCFDNAFRFLEQAVGQSQELVLFVTEITAGYDTSFFVENYGCDAYFRHNKELLLNETRQRIIGDIADLKAAAREL